MANAVHCVSYCVSLKNEETKVSATFKTLLHLNFSDKPKQSLVDIFVGLRLTRMGGFQEVWISSKNALPVASSRGLRYWRVTHKEPAGTSGGLGMWPIQDQYAENDTDEQQFIHTLWLL